MAKRSDLFDPTDPAHMTPKQRLSEVATILAASVIRMPRRRQRMAETMPETCSESGPIRLELSRLASFDGEVEFRLGFYRIRGLLLAPGVPGSRAYMWGRADADRPRGAQPFADDNLLQPPVRIHLGDMPDQVSWKLVSRVYQRFGYPLDEQVPFFDADHRFTLGQLETQGGTA